MKSFLNFSDIYNISLCFCLISSFSLAERQLSCNSTRSAAELGIVLIPTVSGFHNQLAVCKVWIVHAILLDLKIFNNNINRIFPLAIPIAGPAPVVSTVIRLCTVDSKGVVEEHSYSGGLLQWEVVLHPGSCRSNSTVDITRYTYIWIQRESCLC